MLQRDDDGWSHLPFSESGDDVAHCLPERLNPFGPFVANSKDVVFSRLAIPPVKHHRSEKLPIVRAPRYQGSRYASSGTGRKRFGRA